MTVYPVTQSLSYGVIKLSLLPEAQLGNPQSSMYEQQFLINLVSQSMLSLSVQLITSPEICVKVYVSHVSKKYNIQTNRIKHLQATVFVYYILYNERLLKLFF